MKIKTTMRYHPQVKITIIKKIRNKYRERCGKRESSCTVGGNAIENSIAVPQKNRKCTYHMIYLSHFWVFR